jgi:hypothetical protein
MTSSRKWKFPVLIGGAIVAAGILFYFAHARVNSNATQGAIAHRDVYRDGDVKPGDVGTPGEAPVAVTAVLQNANFKELAKNPAFNELLHDKSFAAATQQGQFASLLNDTNFRALSANSLFVYAMQNNQVRDALLSNMKAELGAQLKVALSTAHAQALLDNSNFNSLVTSGALRSALSVNAIAQVMSQQAFYSVAKSSAFNALVSDRSFQLALANGSSAQLANKMRALE